MNRIIFGIVGLLLMASVAYCAENTPSITHSAEKTPPVESLIKDLDSGDYVIRHRAVNALGKSHDLRAVEPLIDYLKKEKYGEKSGVQALISVGNPAVESLIAAFNDEKYLKNVNFRSKIAEVLGGIKDPMAVEPLIRVLNDEDLNIRIQAAVALGKIGDNRAVKALILSLNDKHYMVREYVAEALGKLKDPSSIMPLFAALKDPSVRSYTAKALAQIDAAHTIELANAAIKENPTENCIWAIPAMQDIGDPAVESILSLLNSPNDEVRKRSANALQNLLAARSAKRQKIVDGIIAFFESGRGSFMNPDEQVTVLELTEDPRAVKLMIRLLSSTNGTLPHELASALNRRYISGIAEAAFLEALGDKDENIRIGAVEALGYLKSTRAVEQIIGFLKEKNDKMRMRAAQALGEIRDPRAVESLIALAKDKQEIEDVRLQAIWALWNFKGPQRDAAFKEIKNDKSESDKIIEAAMSGNEMLKKYYPAIKAGLDRKAPSKSSLAVRVDGALFLTAAGEPEKALKPLLDGLQDKDPAVRDRSMIGLMQRKDPRVIKPLIAMLRVEKEEELRRAAMKLLYGMKNYLKAQPFIEILKNKNEIEQNRIFAIQILGELKKHEAIEPLIVILKDAGEKENIRKEALQALKKIKVLGLQGVLLFLLDRNDIALNQFVTQSLKQLTGQDFGDDPAKIRNWLNKIKSAGIPLEEMTPATAPLQEIEPVKPEQAVPEAPLIEKKKEPLPAALPPGETAPLMINITSDKQIYEEGEPIIITTTIKNVSKEKVSVFTRSNKGLWAINSNQEKISCDIPPIYQATAVEKQDYIILEPNQVQTLKHTISHPPMPELKPDTYTIVDYYYGNDEYYYKGGAQKIEYPWTGTVVSNVINIQVVAKETLAPVKKAWEDFLIALKSGDENKVKALSTDRGYKSLLGLFPPEIKGGISKCSDNSFIGSYIRWAYITETSARGYVGPEIKEQGISLINVNGKWKFDRWTAGN